MDEKMMETDRLSEAAEEGFNRGYHAGNGGGSTRAAPYANGTRVRVIYDKAWQAGYNLGRKHVAEKAAARSRALRDLPASDTLTKP
jgi:ribosome modulation factor